MKKYILISLIIIFFSTNSIMLADGNAEFTKKIGLTLDGSNFGMGIRSQRYAMIIRNGVIDTLLVEEGGGVKISSAESILNIL